MIIGLRGGHSPNCKGASGYLDEQSCVRELYYKVKLLLEAQGHTVIDCNSNASSVNGELNEGTNKCNNAGCDLYIPLHMNASNGQGNGVECWTYSSNSSTANAIGNRVCSSLASLGLQNRGVKHNTGYHDTRAVKGQTCLIEVLFCDNKHDCDIWNNVGINKIASLIVSAICNKTINCNSSNNSQNTSSSGSSYSVREIQTMLTKIGYPCGNIDNIWGEKTALAVRCFQRDCNLVADSIVGNNTYTKIKAEYNKKICNSPKPSKPSNNNGWINLDGKTGTICTPSGVNVREKKSTSSRILGTLSNGAKVQLYRKEGDWIHIYYPPHGGYVYAKYIRY